MGSIAVVNGLRGWAIAGVVWHHAAQPFVTPSGFASRNVGGYLVSPLALFSHGSFGVNLFFLLSGFVLALPYARRLRSMASPADARDYYVRRAWRLLPLYYVVIFVSLFMRPLAKLSSNVFFHDVIELATFTFGFDETRWFNWYDPVLWSLAVEVWFSVAFPFLVVAWQRFGIRRVLFVVASACFAARLYVTFRHPERAAPLGILKDSLAGRLDDFVVGMALADWFVRRPRWSGGAVFASLLGGLALLVLSANAWDNILVHRVPYQVASVINDVQAAAFALIVAALLASPPRALAAPFVAPPIQLIGMMSYSIYLWHTIGGQRPDMGHEDIPVYLVLCFVLSAITYRFVEFPKRTFRELFFVYPRSLDRGSPSSQ